MKRTFSLLAPLLLASLTALHAADDLPEPPVSWKYPPEMPGANVEVYREVNGIKLNAYIFTPPNHQGSDASTALSASWTSSLYRWAICNREPNPRFSLPVR